MKPAVKKNREQLKHNNFYTEMLTTALASKGDSGTTRKTADQMENIIDIRYLRKYYVLIIHRPVNDFLVAPFCNIPWTPSSGDSIYSSFHFIYIALFFISVYGSRWEEWSYCAQLNLRKNLII